MNAAASGMEQLSHRQPAPAVAEDRAGAMLVIDAVQLCCNGVESLVPRDAHPFVLAPQIPVGILAAARLPALTAHGILQAIDIVKLLAKRAALRTAALLRGLISVLVKIIGLLAHHRAVDHIGIVAAPARAILTADHRQPFAATLKNCRIGVDHMVRLRRTRVAQLVLAALRGATRKTGSGKRGRRSGAPLQEIAALNTLFQ